VNAVELKIYDQLLQFTLFQGLSRSELLQMAGNTKFGFQKVPARHLVVSEGDACRGLYFLVSGSLQQSTVSDDHGYTVEEKLSAPFVLQPEMLFGLNQRYSSTFKTLSDSHFIVLSKEEVMRLVDSFLIIRLNLLNLLATQGHRQAHRPWRRVPRSLEERVVRFFLDHCSYPAGSKTFYILMRRLAAEVGDSRLDVSRVLNALQARGLLSLYRGRIEIPSLERLLM